MIYLEAKLYKLYTWLGKNVTKGYRLQIFPQKEIVVSPQKGELWPRIRRRGSRIP